MKENLRRMNYLSQPLEDKYDAIIIVAGIGGLTYGCYLNMAEMKVLIVEQPNKPGGCCTPFTYKKGITFDATVHTLKSCKEGGLLGQELDELDLRDKVKLSRMDPSDIIIIEDYGVPINII